MKKIVIKNRTFEIDFDSDRSVAYIDDLEINHQHEQGFYYITKVELNEEMLTENLLFVIEEDERNELRKNDGIKRLEHQITELEWLIEEGKALGVFIREIEKQNSDSTME